MPPKILSLSGGKNSTAMLFLILEQNRLTEEDRIVFIDTGIEFEENLKFIKHLNSILKEAGHSVEVIKPPKSFHYYCFHKPIERGKRKGQKGYGVPFCVRNKRWCQRVLKREPFINWLRKENIDECEILMGYSANEKKRVGDSLFGVKYAERYGLRYRFTYPLVEQGWDDAKCLIYCKTMGVLNPLYRFFNRFGCRFCPCYTINEWRTLYVHFPKYFKQALRIEKKSIKLTGRTFRSDYTLEELKERFEKELNERKLIARREGGRGRESGA